MHRILPIRALLGFATVLAVGVLFQTRYVDADQDVGITFDRPLFAAPYSAASTKDWIAVSHTDGHVIVIDRGMFDHGEATYRIFRPPRLSMREASRSWRVAISPDGEMMALATPRNENSEFSTSEVFFVSLDQPSPYLWQGVRRVVASSAPNQVGFTPDGRYFIVGYDGGSSGLDVINTETLDQVPGQLEIGNVQGVATLSNSHLIVAGTSSGSLHSVQIVDRGNGVRLEAIDQQAQRGPIVRLAAHPTQPWVAVSYRTKHAHATSACGNSEEHLVVDVVEVDPTDGKFLGTIRTFVAPEDPNLEKYPGQRIDRVTWSRSGNELYASGFVWRALDETSPQIRIGPHPERVPSYPLKNQRIAQGIFHWNVEEGGECVATWLPIGADGVTALAPFGQHGVFAAARDPAYATFEPRDDETKTFHFQYWPASALDLRHQVYEFAVSNDLRRVWLETVPTDGRLIRFNFDEGIISEIHEEIFNNEISSASVEKHEPILEGDDVVAGWKTKKDGLLIDEELDIAGILRPMAPNGEQIELDYEDDILVREDRYRSMHPYDIRNNVARRVILGSYNFLRIVNRLPEVEATVRIKHAAHRISFVDGQNARPNVFVAVHGDGIIRYYRKNQEKLVLFLSLAIDRQLEDWVFWTPSGFYYGVGEILEDINFNGIGNATTVQPASLDEVREALSCRDIISQLLTTRDEVQALKNVLQILKNEQVNPDELDECTVLRDLWDDAERLTPKKIQDTANAAFLRTALQIISPGTHEAVGGHTIHGVKVSFHLEGTPTAVRSIRLSLKGRKSSSVVLDLKDLGSGAILTIPEDLRCKGGTLTLQATPLDGQRKPLPGHTSRFVDLEYVDGEPCEKPSMWAVILGEDYDNEAKQPDISILRGAENDAHAVLQFLCDRTGQNGDFQKLHTLTVGFLNDSEFTNYRGSCLSENSENFPSFVRMPGQERQVEFSPDKVQIWLENMIGEHNEFREQISPRDLIFMYFSGHGYQNRGGIFYIVPSTFGSKMKSRRVSLRNFLPQELVIQELESGVRLYAFFDACRRGDVELKEAKTAVSASDLWTMIFKSNEQFKETTDRGGIFLASRWNQPSWEGEVAENGKMHGVFTAALLEGLSGWADLFNSRKPNKREGVVDTEDLLEFLECRVPNLSAEVLSNPTHDELQQVEHSYTRPVQSRLTAVTRTLRFGRRDSQCLPPN